MVSGVDNSSSSCAENHKNNCLVVAEGKIFCISGSFDSPKANTKFLLEFTL